MNKKQSRRRRDIKSKLMAAICMLLVSSIMMVSTTYAWFTLSTAPEVTGITTAVGANGNLEMALLPLSGNTDDITSNVGDSYQTANKTNVTANVTWGNLVDLSDASYGLSEIALYPSALNYTTGTDGNGNVVETLGGAYLQTPLYGVDGRVTELAANTVTSTYEVGEGFPNNSNFGVRAVGTAAGMTDRQLTYRNAQSDASSAMAQAKNAAAISLNTNGAALANIAMAHAANADATHTQDDVTALLNIVTDLEGATGKTGALQHVEEAYVKYLLAHAASSASGLSDEQFTAVKAFVTGKTLSEVVNGLTTTYGVKLPESVSTNIDALEATKAKVSSAKTKLTTLKNGGSNTIAWSGITSAMSDLIDTSKLTINNYGIDEVKNNLGGIVGSIGSMGGLTVKMPTGGGIYADIADHCGDFSASITLKNLSAGGFTMETMDARMQADSTLTTSYLSLVGEAVAGKAPAGASGADVPVTDFYGYIIDLAFRTNAASSDLLLQTAGIDRIYKDSNGAVQDDGSTTMGNGSTMTFAAVDTSFNNEQVTALMQAIRVVFFDKGTGNILAKGRLDAASAKPGADGITMNLVLYKEVVTYVEATEGATHISDGKGGYRPVEGTETATHKVSGTAMTNLDQEHAVITALNQNAAHTVSVLVYLDGNLVTNREVSATGSKSVTGKMNLQFSSSAQLTPMVYTPLTQQTGKVALPGTMLKTINVSGEATAVGAFEEDAVTIALTAAEGKEITAVTAVSVGNTALESTAYTYANGKLTFTSTGITEDTVVAITVTTANKA